MIKTLNASMPNKIGMDCVISKTHAKQNALIIEKDFLGEMAQRWPCRWAGRRDVSPGTGVGVRPRRISSTGAALRGSRTFLRPNAMPDCSRHGLPADAGAP
jgi:hypothetical protein